VVEFRDRVASVRRWMEVVAWFNLSRGVREALQSRMFSGGFLRSDTI